MKLAVLWPEMTGYLNACLRATVALGHELYVARRAATAAAPFDDSLFDWPDRRYVYAEQADPQRLAIDLERFAPDALLVCSWHRGAFRAVLPAWRGRAVRVLYMDNSWRGTPKQWLGRVVSRFYVRPLYDAVFLPGERQAVFARMLGFAPDEIWTGGCVADAAAFDRGRRTMPAKPGSILLAARLSPEKGIEELAGAWHLFSRDAEFAGWRLVVAGVGPSAGALADLDGVTMLDFVQPTRLPDVYRSASGFVLPSRFEPWGAAVNEACAAGLPIIVTTAVGAAPHLLREGCNGWSVPPNRPDLIAGRLRDLARLDESEWQRMSEASRALASSYTPEGWARHLVSQCKRAAAMGLRR